MPRTHYDNLQVSRMASDRVIRAAYKSLSQEWHPDKHPKDTAKAEKITKIINQAYKVLSDAQLRKEHDEWIAREEAREALRIINPEPAPSPPKNNNAESNSPGSSEPVDAESGSSSCSVFFYDGCAWVLWLCVAGAFIWAASGGTWRF